MAKKTPYARAKARALKVYSEYIRKKEADADGMVHCVTCKKRFHWTQVQCGHGMAGRGNNILFCADLCHCQCKYCNIFKGGDYDNYHKYLIDRYGMDRYDELLLLKNGKDAKGNTVITKFTIGGLEKMIQGWKEEMKGFKCQ